MSENEMNLDEPVTRRDLKELALKSDLNALRSELNDMNVNLNALRSELKNDMNVNLNALRSELKNDMNVIFAQHANAILEDIRGQIRALDDQYHGLPERVTKLETAVFSPPPPKRKRKAG